MRTRTAQLRFKGLSCGLCSTIAFALMACEPPAHVLRADKSVYQLISGIPTPEELPTSLRIETGVIAANFNNAEAIRRLNEVLSSSRVAWDDPEMRADTGPRKAAGALIISAEGKDTKYRLERPTSSSNLWILLLADRSHPSSSLFYFRDDGRFTKLLESHRASHNAP